MAFEDEIPAYCPEIEFALSGGSGGFFAAAARNAGRTANRAQGVLSGLQQGRDYDMVVSESVNHSNEFTAHPIEDPTRSFLIDHNREQPVEIGLTMIVSTVPCATGAVSGIERVRLVQETLLAIRARQSVATDSFIRIYTGVRTYHNMGIRSLGFTREPETPNTMQIDIGLFEFRLAQSPRLDNERGLMQANNGHRDDQNRPLVNKFDRPIVEKTRVRRAPRMSYPLPSQEALIRTALRKLGVGQLRALDILSQTGTI